MTQLVARERIAELESSMRAMDGQIKIEPKHYFSAGLYAREVFLPADTTAVGKIHRTENMSILAQGKISVTTDEGTNTFEAPRVIIAPPNVKRAVYAHTDCTWITVHATSERDLVKLEEELITEDYLSIEDTKVIS